MTKEEFGIGWAHFCKCVNFEHSNLDAEAIRFMNEMPACVADALLRDAKSKKCDSAESSTNSKPL